MTMSPNLTQNLAVNDERLEGDVIESDSDGSTDALSIPLSDDQVHALTNRIEKDKKWWNEELDLDNVRDRNEKYYLNVYTEEELYEYQESSEYKNNRIFTAVETLIAVVLSQKAEPTVMPGGDTDADYQKAQDLQASLLAIYEDLYLKHKAALVARHLLIGLRLGVMRLRFDPDRGEKMPDGTRKGGIVIEVRRPQQIVLGRGVTDADNIDFIADFDEDTIENLCARFPKKKDEIYSKFGIKRGTTSQLQKRVGFVTCWFDYRDKSGEIQNAVCWKIDELVLDAKKNMNYNYDEWSEPDAEGKQHRLNFFDRPKPPYILFNHLNLGKYAIDSTSLSEQAQPMQRILNKRGRQIVEAADQAASGMVLNEEQINQEDASKLTGDFREKIMVKGDVRTAAARLPRTAMEPFVIRDKDDARREIDNIFGANAAIQGEGDSDTLGQDVMSQRANMGRLQVLADSMEDGFDRLYKYVAQMEKVYFDEDVEMSYEGTEGNAMFVTMNQNKVDPKQKVRVKAGSMIPKDKWAQRNETIQALAILDPLSIAEGLDKPNPKEWAKRLVYYRFQMDKYLSDILSADESGQDQEAIADIQTIIQTKQMPNVPPQPEQSYILTLQNFIQGEGFKTLQPDVQQILIQFAEAVLNASKGAMGDAPAAPAPTEEAPGEEPVQPGGGEGEVPVDETATPTPGTPTPTPPGQDVGQPQGSSFIQRLMSRIRGK